MIWRPPLWMRLALGGALLAGGLPARSAEPAVLTRAAAVHALDPAEAERAQPVLLTGVVTHYNRLLADGFFLQDDTDGVYVRLGDTKPELLPGDRVEIAGTTATGDFAPVVVLRALTKLGRAELPAAVPVSLADLASGRYDSRRVEVRGTVWAATPASPRGDSHLTLQLRIDGQDLLIGVNRYSPASLQLADARVRVRGVAAGIFSRQRQILAPVVVAESDEQIEILEAPPPPDALPVQTIRMIFGHNPVTPTDRRVRIRGQVLAQPVAGWLAVRDEHSGLFVSVTPGTDLQPGDLVELTGFPSIREKNLSLTHAVARRHGHTPLPPAKTGTITEGLASHCERFRIEGTLTGPPALGAGSWVLNVRAGPAEYEALVPATGGPAPESWRAGARVAVTGITEPFFLPRHRLELRPFPDGLRLHAGAPDDVAILAPAPWSTSPHFLRVLVSTLAGVLVLLGSVSIVAVVLARKNRALRATRKQLHAAQEELARRFTARTGEWHEELAARHAAEADFALLTAERTRLARELHDTLEQAMASVALQLDAVQGFFQSRPAEAHRLLVGATHQLRETQGEVRRSVWNLRALKLENATLVDALEQLAKALSDAHGPAVRVTCTGELRGLPPGVASHLFRIAQEGLTNALKHSGSPVIDLHLRFEPAGVTLEIADRGGGFDPAAPVADGRFGLRGLRERALAIGAQFTLESAPGRGTCVRITVPADRLSLD